MAFGCMSCSLKVDTSSSKWHKKLNKVLKKIKGLSYNIDVEEGVAHISGQIDPQNLLKKLEKAKKDVKLIEVHSEDTYMNIPNVPGHGYGYYNDYAYNHYQRVEPYWDYPQRAYPSGPYPHYPSLLPPPPPPQYFPHPHYPYYEPPPQCFPQPPPPVKVHPLYDPHYSCSIM